MNVALVCSLIWKLVLIYLIHIEKWRRVRLQMCGRSHSCPSTSSSTELEGISFDIWFVIYFREQRMWGENYGWWERQTLGLETVSPLDLLQIIVLEEVQGEKKHFTEQFTNCLGCHSAGVERFVLICLALGISHLERLQGASTWSFISKHFDHFDVSTESSPGKHFFITQHSFFRGNFHRRNCWRT